MAHTLMVAADKARDGVIIALKADDKARRVRALQAAHRASLELAGHITDELARLGVTSIGIDWRNVDL
jgi:hypothetical protein